MRPVLLPPRGQRGVVVLVATLAGVSALGAAFAAGLAAGSAHRGATGEVTIAGVLDQAASEIADGGLEKVDRDALDAAAIRGMLTAAGDPWGSWSDSAGDSAGSYVGIGVWLRTTRSGAVVVARVSTPSAAAAAGVRPDDEIRAVGGRVTTGLTAPVVAAALRGPAGSAVSVVTRRDGTVRTLRLVRAAVPSAGVAVAVEQSAHGGPTITRISVPTFFRGVGRQVRDAVGASRTAGIVLDLRGDPGGLLDEAVETASAFLDGGPVVTYTRRDGHTVTLDAVGRGNTRVPLVVLVDGGTASAAEVVAGALQDRGRAVLVGSRTFGKASVQEPTTLTDGSALDITVARYRTPSGRSLEGIGLEPDIEVAQGLAPEVAERRAVEVLTGLVADSTPLSGGRG